MKVKPWKKIGKPETLATSNGRDLLVQRYRDPHTNKMSDYSLFKGLDFASIVLAITAEKKVLITKQYRHAADAIVLELPGGTPKHPGQLPESVAREEVAEETMGYEPEKVIPLAAGKCWFDPTSFLTAYYPFLFTGCKKGNKSVSPEKGEYIELIEMPLEEWVEMVFSGKISDSKSVVVTMLALRHLGYSLRG